MPRPQSLAGIKVKNTKIALYVISALLAAVAGVLSTSRFGVSTPTLGLRRQKEGQSDSGSHRRNQYGRR